MAVKELTVEEKLVALAKLQIIDSKIDEIETLRGELPIEVNDLEDELAGLNTRIGKINDEMKEYTDEIANRKLAAKQAETLIQRYQEQQNNVKNNREFDALSKEIELQNLEIQLSEKKIKEAHHSIDAKKDFLKDSEALIESKKKDLVLKKEELERIVNETSKEEEVLRKDSEKAKVNIEERLLKAYARVRKNYVNGMAVVPIERNSCGGCFNRIPPQRQSEISQRKKVIVCEHCGRILVDPALIEEVRESVKL